MSAPTHRRQWFTTADIAAMVGLSPRTIVREILLGELVACRVRRAYRIPRGEAKRYVLRVGGEFMDVADRTDRTDRTDTRTQHG